MHRYAGVELDVNVDPQQADCVLLDEEGKKRGPDQDDLGQSNTSQDAVLGMIKTTQESMMALTKSIGMQQKQSINRSEDEG